MESGYIVVCNASVTVVPVPFYEYGVGLQGTVGPTGSPDAWSLIFLVFLSAKAKAMTMTMNPYHSFLSPAFCLCTWSMPSKNSNDK